jgi:soluble lytic murein transglycosylase-like protein
MFYHESNIEAKKMRIRTSWIGRLLAAVAVTVSTTSVAQSAPAPESDPSPQRDGYRLAQFDGFQLVEHGIWQRPVNATAPQSAEVRQRPLTVQSEPRGNTVPSGFRRAGYLPHIFAAEAKYALPTGLLDALVWTESRYNPLAVSRAGAAGMGQLMPATAKDLGISNRFDPLSNIDGAARYLRQMMDKFGVVHLALAAYNAGPRAVERAGGIPRNGETPDYVRNVLRSWRY